MKSPLVSIVLAVKNGMPLVQQAIAALQEQGYKNMELIVQDGLSTDGSAEYLRSLKGFVRVDVDSRRDSGIGQAYNRGLERCQGDLVCMIACDEMLAPGAIRQLVKLHSKFPDAASIYGCVQMLGENGEKRGIFRPRPFDLFAFMKCTLFPTTAGLLKRSVIGSEFYYDETLKTCPDYDFWIRLGLKFGSDGLMATNQVYAMALETRASTSFRSEALEQFCMDKMYILNRFVSKHADDETLNQLRSECAAGIWAWAAEAMLGLEGPTTDFYSLCQQGLHVKPGDDQLLRLVNQGDQIKKSKGATS